MKKFILLSIAFFTCCFAHAQELETLIREAMENSPEIQKFELQYSIVSEKVNEVNTVPNTELGFGYFVSEPETRTGAQRFKISARQMIPWFGSITARENYMSSLADAKYEDIAIAKRQLLAAVSQSYYRLFANKAKQEVLTQNIQLLQTYETLALTSVEVGNASAVDVLRLQMRKNELRQLKEVLAQEYLSEQTFLNKLLNRDKDVEISVVDELSIPSEITSVSLADLSLHPELIKYDKLYESVEQSELLNQKESNSMIGFGLDYIYVEKRPGMDFSDNGKDVLMPMVSLAIPIFNKKYKSQSRQNELRQLEIQTEKQERLNKLESALDKALKDRLSAEISYKTQTMNLNQSRKAEEMLIKSYESGTIDFNDVLDIQELQLKFQLNQIESIKSYYVQNVIINYLSN